MNILTSLMATVEVENVAVQDFVWTAHPNNGMSEKG